MAALDRTRLIGLLPLPIDATLAAVAFLDPAPHRVQAPTSRACQVSS
jgi:hypothetical protein